MKAQSGLEPENFSLIEMSKPKNENTLEMITSQNRYSHRVWFELSTQNKNNEKEKHLKAEGSLSTFERRQGEQSLNLGLTQLLIQNLWTWIQFNFRFRIFEPGLNTIFDPEYLNLGSTQFFIQIIQWAISEPGFNTISDTEYSEIKQQKNPQRPKKFAPQIQYEFITTFHYLGLVDCVEGEVDKAATKDLDISCRPIIIYS